jgi:hypothetical protein
VRFDGENPPRRVRIVETHDGRDGDRGSDRGRVRSERERRDEMEQQGERVVERAARDRRDGDDGGVEESTTRSSGRSYVRTRNTERRVWDGEGRNWGRWQ